LQVHKTSIEAKTGSLKVNVELLLKKGECVIVVDISNFP